MKCEGIPASGGIGIGEAVLVAEPDLGYGDVVFSGVEAEKARLAGVVRGGGANDPGEMPEGKLKAAYELGKRI